MRPDEERAALDPLLPARRFAGLEPGVLQRARNIAGRMPSRFTQRGRQRPIRDDRANARNDHGNRSGQMRGQLAKT